MNYENEQAQMAVPSINTMMDELEKALSELGTNVSGSRLIEHSIHDLRQAGLTSGAGGLDEPGSAKQSDQRYLTARLDRIIRTVYNINEQAAQHGNFLRQTLGANDNSLSTLQQLPERTKL